ncbi:hypothetical protein QCD79_16250, partial [Pseudomonas quasicaspiana]|nr:hypothetical protein [Pseudomonas quasicaspiana]
TPAFLCRQNSQTATAPGFKGFSKVGTGPAIYSSTRTTKTRSAKHHNKNNTNRLTHNKNNTAEAQLTDSFGEALYLGLAPQPGREQQKLPLGSA